MAVEFLQILLYSTFVRARLRRKYTQKGNHHRGRYEKRGRTGSAHHVAVHPHVSQVARHRGRDRRHRRAGRLGLSPERELGGDAARRAPVAAVAAARGRPAHRGHLPPDQNGKQEHQRHHRRHPLRRQGAAAARAGDLPVDRHHAPVRRQRRARGRRAADRRQPRLLHRAAVPPR